MADERSEYDKLNDSYKKALESYKIALKEYEAAAAGAERKARAIVTANARTSANAAAEKLPIRGELGKKQKREYVKEYIQQYKRKNRKKIQKYIQDSVEKAAAHLEAMVLSFETSILEELKIPSSTTQKYKAFFQAGKKWIHFQLEPCPTHVLSRTSQEKAGWKYHISIHPNDLSRAWPTVRQHLFDSRLGIFKLIAAPGIFPAEQKGKQVTAYIGYDLGVRGVSWKRAIANIESALGEAKIERDEGFHPNADCPLGHYTSYRNDYMSLKLLEQLLVSPNLQRCGSEKKDISELIDRMRRKRTRYIDLKDIRLINGALRKAGLRVLIPKYSHNPSYGLAIALGISKVDFFNLINTAEIGCQHFNPFQDPFVALGKRLAAQKTNSQHLYGSDRIEEPEGDAKETVLDQGAEADANLDPDPKPDSETDVNLSKGMGGGSCDL